MKREMIVLVTCSLGAWACSGDKEDAGDSSAGVSASAGEDGGSDSAGDSGDSGGDSGGDSSGSSGDTGAGDEGTGDTGNFLGDPDAGDGNNECDVFGQDCPPGQKCMPWANDGGNSWNGTKCSPIDDNPKVPGDDCTVEGSGVSGIDDCDEGVMCYNVDPATNQGVCYEICGGDASTPTCDAPGTVCAIYNDGVLPLCYAECDPLLTDCPGADLCLPSPQGDAFVCILDSLPNDDGGYQTPCEYTNTCDPGLFCATAAIVPDCNSTSGCCSEFCDLKASDPDSECSGQAQGQTCQPWWGEETPPPGYDHIGFCGLPL